MFFHDLSSYSYEDKISVRTHLNILSYNQFIEFLNQGLINTEKQ